MSKFYIKSGAILAALCLGFASSAASQPAAEATRAITAPDAQAAVKETTVSGVAPMPIKAPPINEVVKMRAAREAWRKSVLLAPKPKKGCFEAAYPDAKWTEVPCVTPPLRPYPPRSGIRPDAVGNGLDFSAEVTGDATSSEGSFDSVSGVTSEAGGGTANTYSLQLNTEFFTTTTCGGAKTPASCRGWEQYVFSNSPPSSGAVFIQYWLINYVNACPSGWTTYGSDCYRNSTGSTSVPAQTISTLGDLTLTGSAGTGGGDDAYALSTGTHVYSGPGDNYFPDLAQHWQISEFNIFGDCCGSQAVFNSGSTLTVRTAMSSGTTVGPACDLQGFTGETNNLTLVNTAPTATTGNAPALVFSESFPAAAGPTATCADATSVGDTHMTTFDGVHYDFQASGDFVLAQDGPDFIVQSRQASGASIGWPNASVNKGVAAQLGTARVAFHVEPARLVIDGRDQDLADGATLELGGGAQISRHGMTYVATRQTGDSVTATLNNGWIDVTIGLGHTPRPTARGLLGNPGGHAYGLRAATGAMLKAPVAFADLYGAYAQSWRVQPNQSLFTMASAFKFGIPTRPFYASHLAPAAYARARAVCTAAGVTSPTLLDDCTLDNAVLKDETAARVFVLARTPRLIIRPVLLHPKAVVNVTGAAAQKVVKPQ